MRNTRSKKSGTPSEPDGTMGRRGFLGKLWLGLGALVLGEIIYLVASFLGPRKPRSRQGEYGSIVEAGTVESFPLDSVTAFPRGHFYLARLEDGGFLALSRRCTHLGCTVPWIESEKRFLCPCHSSAFDIRGELIDPPAPRALDLYRVTIEHTLVKVDTGQLLRRSHFQSSQVVYPSDAS